jgi:hypothetical protein
MAAVLGDEAKPSVSRPGGFAVCTQNDKATTATSALMTARLGPGT